MKVVAVVSVVVGLTVFMASVAPVCAFDVQVTNGSRDCDVADVKIVRQQQAVTIGTVALKRGESTTIHANDEEKGLCPDAIRVFFKAERGSKCHFIPGTACLDGGAEPCKPSCANARFEVLDKKQNNLSVPDIRKR